MSLPQLLEDDYYTGSDTPPEASNNAPIMRICLHC
jgi:hypothetical protein